MKQKTLLTQALFTKAADDDAWQTVALPHTWNALDGQDGGADYDRGAYRYKMNLPAPTQGKRQFVQFEGANHIATVYCNGEALGVHEGGFATFRFELTATMRPDGNELLVLVDNRESHVYPQQADFTFYGGLYRNVTYIEAEQTHFALLLHGSDSVFVTPDTSGAVRVDAFCEAVQPGDSVCCRVLDANGVCVAETTADAKKHAILETNVPAPHLWHGLDDPYCYMAELALVRNGTTLDKTAAAFGFRTYSVNPETGFVLNGKPYPLHGVSRHQDRQDKGWAICEADHAQDLALIQEVGANTIRLAHYQHARHFYNLCDKAGMILWAEIPFISLFMEGEAARADTLHQMTELIVQNYNHPAICFWGISNEITIGGECDALLENLQAVNALAKKLDPSRLTTMAQVCMLDMASPHNQITDVLSYNHYFGWYMGTVDENGPWLDNFHSAYPNRALGVSEYGSEGVLQWHSASSECHDYTEEYQAYYHEEMLKTFAARPYLWATHLWNMFDFAADARDEGGVKGRNNKGVVTYDRKTKKDAFYVYKAFWAKDLFVHLCGARFADRAPGERDVKVYSNCPSVTLFVNGTPVETLSAEKIFVFKDVALSDGANLITAKAAGAADDTITLNGTPEPNAAYKLPQENADAGNWFDVLAADGKKLEFPDGFFSIRDKIGDILAHSKAGPLLQEMMGKAMGGDAGMGKTMKNMMGFIKNMQLENVLQMAGKRIPAEAKYYLNDLLTKIKK